MVKRQIEELYSRGGVRAGGAAGTGATQVPLSPGRANSPRTPRAGNVRTFPSYLTTIDHSSHCAGPSMRCG
jgi:hypothetical protein